MSETSAPYGSGPSRPDAPKPRTPEPRKIRIHHLREMKERGERWAMLTAYEQYAAQTFDEAGIPVLLVGDSASNNVYGNETSLPVTVDELIPLVRAVTR
jgi:3-methyl-2-oxobutanoate hydroxymethyltransferase